MEDLQGRLDVQVARLSSGELAGRVKKRVMAKIGDIKKQIAAYQLQHQSRASSVENGRPTHGSAAQSPASTAGTAATAGGSGGSGSSKRDAKRRRKDGSFDGGASTHASSDKAALHALLGVGQADGGEGAGGVAATSVAAVSTAAAGTVQQQPLSGRAEKRGRAEEKQKRKKKTLHLNRQLADLAQRKQLKEASKAFRRGVRQGVVDVHSYTNLLNAHVRCGDVAGAQTVFFGMPVAGIAPNVVTYTTLMKGLCDAGDLNGAQKVLAEMAASKKVTPNLRTVNTFLRGCVRVGDVAAAEDIFQKLGKWGVEPDASAYESMTILFCQALRLDDVRALLGQLRKAAAIELSRKEDGGAASKANTAGLSGEVDAAHNPALYISYARGCAMLGEWGLCKEALRWADAGLDEDTYLNRSQRHAESKPEHDKKGAARKGKGGFALDSSKKQHVPTSSLEAAQLNRAKNLKRIKSVRQFARHRLDELKLEASLVQSFAMTKMKELTLLEGLAEQTHGEDILRNLGDFYSRVFYFAVEGGGSADDETGGGGGGAGAAGTAGTGGGGGLIAGASLMEVRAASEGTGDAGARERSLIIAELKAQVVDRFGLAFCSKCLLKRNPDAPSLRETSTRKLDSSFSADSKIDFAKVFGGARADLPTMLEVCSGGGEWAVDQARYAGETANWVTLELRHDRVYRTFARAVLNDVKNLCAIGGDAAYVLRHHFAPGSCNSVFINHPEPPERTGGVDDSEGGHLLTTQFFEMLQNVLLPGGTVTLVTDNLAYGKSLAETCARVGMKSITLNAKKGRLTLDHPVISTVENNSGGTVVLYEGEAGPECGHHVMSSSYFDRLWKGGSKTRRFFFCASF